MPIHEFQNRLLDGGAGTDFIDGGFGNDTLTGGDELGFPQGNIFHFDNNYGVDTIVDFQQGADVINISRVDGSPNDVGSMDIQLIGSDTYIFLEEGTNTTIIILVAFTGTLTNGDFFF